MNKSTLAIIALFLLPASTFGAPWEFAADFEQGTVGAQAQGPSGFSDAFSQTLYSNQKAFSGSQSAMATINAGSDGWGIFGGQINFSAMGKGSEIWLRWRVFFPTGFNFTANPWLKFARIHTSDSAGNNVGYNDIYIYNDLSLHYIYEGEGVWVALGASVARNEWDTYEFYLKLDNVPVSQGGTGEVRVWKNGVLLSDITNRETLKNATDVADLSYLFTYWNGGAPQTQSLFLDDVVATNTTPAARDAQGHPMIGTGPNPIKSEAENLTVANYLSQAGGTARLIGTDANLSNSNGMILDSNNTGDYMTFVLPNVAAGTYDVTIGVKDYYSRGKFQLQIGRADNFSGTATNVGPVVDEYTASAVYAAVDLGLWSPATTSDKWFRFNVVGKNSSSSGSSYNDAIAVDYILLSPSPTP